MDKRNKQRRKVPQFAT